MFKHARVVDIFHYFRAKKGLRHRTVIGRVLLTAFLVRWDYQNRFPWFSDAWKMIVRAGKISLATTLRKYEGRLYGPAAL